MLSKVTSRLQLGFGHVNEVLSFHAYPYHKCVNDLHIQVNGSTSNPMGKAI